MIPGDDATGANPTENSGTGTEQLQRDVDRYKRAYYLSEDTRFRKVLTDIIDELEKRLAAAFGDTESLKLAPDPRPAPRRP